MENPGQAIIGNDLIIKGEIRGGQQVEVYGYVEGRIASGHVRIEQGGRVFGDVIADAVDVDGTLQGSARVRNLMNIGGTGAVRGDVRYGKLALATGGELSADLRNVPPELAGDFQLSVRRSRSVLITTEDINAVDPDDAPGRLTFTVTNKRNGFVARANSPQTPIDEFSQADLLAAQLVFVHDGSGGTNASFDVIVTDQAGSSSGSARTVNVGVTNG